LAAEISREFPAAQVTLIPSSGGRFEVLRDGVPIYEKSKLGRHAAKGEIVALLRSSS
jgi:predicted Rdx family selenoprotein